VSTETQRIRLVFVDDGAYHHETLTLPVADAQGDIEAAKTFYAEAQAGFHNAKNEYAAAQCGQALANLQ
jgi:hypothetical protein